MSVNQRLKKLLCQITFRFLTACSPCITIMKETNNKIIPDYIRNWGKIVSCSQIIGIMLLLQNKSKRKSANQFNLYYSMLKCLGQHKCYMSKRQKSARKYFKIIQMHNPRWRWMKVDEDRFILLLLQIQLMALRTKSVLTKVDVPNNYYHENILQVLCSYSRCQINFEIGQNKLMCEAAASTQMC